MVRRPSSIPEARRAMREALDKLEVKGVIVKGKTMHSTPCQDRPVPFTDVRQTPAEAKQLCADCPLTALCAPLGFTESVYADDMVYGGLTWRRGLPLVSETAYQAKRAKNELQKTQQHNSYQKG